MLKLAIFDMDGTLLDTIEDIAAAANHALETCGFPVHTVERYKQMVGSGVHNLVKRAIAPVNDAAATLRVEAAFRSYYGEHAQVHTKPYEGVVEALAALRQKGVGIAVLSNKADNYVKALSDIYFPGLIDMALGHRENVPVKPDPVGMFEIMRRFSCTAEDCAYFGDSDIDMFTGKGAGVYTVGVTWGFRTREELEMSGANDIIDKCYEIVPLVVDN